jgi:hypothetical protein
MPSVDVECEEGDQTISELSDAVDRRRGGEAESEPEADDDQWRLVRPASCPIKRASSVTLNRDGLHLSPQHSDIKNHCEGSVC